jgi:DNA repair exonuclease SbcCD ATPase subunit
MNNLVVLENVNAVEVFGGKGLDDLLGKITEEAKSITPDLTTKKGRDEIAGIAYKVAKSKTYLDGLRKDLVSEWKTKAKAVDAEGRKMRDTLDSLKEEVRRPLTEWEDAKKERIDAHESGIREISGAAEHTANNWMTLPLEAMVDRLKEIENEVIESYEEFAPVAAAAKDRTMVSMKESIVKRETYDKEQAELEKLRAEAAEREQKEAEEKLRLEGEERAKLEAEAKAEEEKERVKLQAEITEKEKNAAIAGKIEAERKAKQAEENVKIEVEKAAQAERDRIEQERINEELAAKKREANKAHKSKIKNAAAKAMVDFLMAYDSGERPLTLAQANLVVTAIAKGQIPYTTISY